MNFSLDEKLFFVTINLQSVMINNDFSVNDWGMKNDVSGDFN